VRFSWRERGPHEAAFSASTIYYTYCFSLPPGTSIATLANDLLKCGLAIAAVWAGDDEVRVAHRYQRLYKLKLQAQGLSDFQRVRDGEIPYWNWARKYPVLAFQLTSAAIKGIAGRHRSVSAPAKVLNKPPMVDQMVAVTNQIEDAMIGARKILGIFRDIEREFYSPGYRSQDPFVRLKLRDFRISSNFFDDEPVLSFLLLHESGTALLTYATAPNDHISTGDVIELSRSDSLHIERAYVDRDFFGKNGVELSESDESSLKIHDDTAWMRVEWDEKVPFSLFFEAHLNRILKNCRDQNDRYSYWRCYSTVILNHLDCCGSRARWLKRHNRELVALTQRFPGYATLKDSLTIPADESIHESMSRYRLVSHCLEINWKFGQQPKRPDMTTDHSIIVLTEHVLLQVWQLQALDWHISSRDWKSQAVEKLEMEIAAGLAEYRRADIVAFGTAQDIVRALLLELGADVLYQRILDRLSALSAVVAGREARSSSRRNVVVAGAAVIAAIALGLPALDQSATLLRSTTKGRIGQIVEPARTILIEHPNAAWLGYIALFGLSLGIFVYSVWRAPRTKKTQTSRRDVGIRWPGLTLKFGRAKMQYRRGHSRTATTIAKERDEANG
jgi:hypothetical protein